MSDRRPLAPGVIALLAGLAVLFGATLASAQPLAASTLTVAPATGTEDTRLGVTTSAGCPQTANAYHVRVTGPGNLNYLITGRTTAGLSTTDPFEAQLGQTFKDAAALNTPPTEIQAGTYTINLNCVSGITGGTIESTFSTTVEFSIAGTVKRYTATGTGPTTTTTTTTITSPTTTSTSEDTSTTTTEAPTTTTTTEVPVQAASNQGTGTLARTGVAPMPLIWLGVLLCLVGSLYLLAARQRRVS